MNSKKKIAILTFFLIFCVYVVAYFVIRDVEISGGHVQVNYEDYGYRFYVLDDPTIDEKAESGTYDFGDRSYLTRAFRPIEIIEMKIRFNLRHY